MLKTERDLFIVGAGAVVVLALIGYAVARKAGQTIAANANLVNPLSSSNVVYQGVNAAGAAITGNKDFSVGASIFELLHPAEPNPAAPTLATPPYVDPWTGGGATW